MKVNMPTIGIKFDIEKAGNGNYGFPCWKVFWQAIGPEEIGVAFLYEGDTAATLSRRESVFCIAVQSLDSKAIGRIKTALSSSEEFKRVCSNPMFVEGAACSSEPLMDAGRIDALGNLVGEAGASRSALGEVKRERTKAVQPAKDVPIPERNKPASDRTRKLPTITTFKELKTFLGKTFTPREYPKECGVCYWMTPEELCDVVEQYADLISIKYDEYSCGASEDMCRVSLFEKNPPGSRPIEFLGLYPFASEDDARSFGQDWSSCPDYAKAMPRLADIRGRCSINFCKGNENPTETPFEPHQGIPPQSLWGRLYLRKRRLLDDLPQTQTQVASKPASSPLTEHKWWQFWR